MNIHNFLVILLTFMGFRITGPKVDLHRKPTREDYMKKANSWIIMNWGFIALAAVLIVVGGFLIFLIWIGGGVSCTESGLLYNQFDKVI